MWSDPRIIELSKQFVPCADEVYRLQSGPDSECRTFRRLVRGDESAHGGTMQGTYVFSPGGKLLARRNTNSPDQTIKLLKDALEKWARLTPEERGGADTRTLNSRVRWDDNYPEDGLVLRRTGRDLPASGKPEDDRAGCFNRDAVWFHSSESGLLVPTEPKVGARHNVPSHLAERLARLSLVDNVRGQTIPYAPSEVKGSWLRTTVTGIQDDRYVELDIEGRTVADAKGPWLLGENYWKPHSEIPHRMHLSILGRATFDRERGVFIAFEAVALGVRTGRTVMCGRNGNDAAGPIGFVLELAPASWRIAPTFINMYDTFWVRHPESPRQGNGKSFSVSCWVETQSPGADFPALLTDKNWNGGKIKDYTTNQAYGRSRTTGHQRGFALALQPNGSWSWNIGDGKHRLDYRPTNERQPASDGKRHLLAFTVDHVRNECRLFHDGHPVAIYSIAGIGPVRSGQVPSRHADAVKSGAIHEKILTPAAVAKMWREGGGAESPRSRPGRIDSLNVLAWNIWHGGRRDDGLPGLQKTIEAIRASGADVICMQETYGSGAIIADALGYHFYLRSTNLSVMSRYPILETHDVYQPFRLGGVTLELPGARKLAVFSLWINHLPSVGKAMTSGKATASKLVAADNATRGREIRGILRTLEPHVRRADEVPLIVAGDYNSPSHLDWEERTRDKHAGLVVPWPVSSAMARHGFLDAFRTLHSDPSKVVGRTWSPRFTNTYQQRIDYVYHKGSGLKATAARVLDRHPKGWPSDHAAVLVTFSLVR